MQRMPNIGLVIQFEQEKPAHLDLRLQVDINEIPKRDFMEQILVPALKVDFTSEKWGWNWRIASGNLDELNEALARFIADRKPVIDDILFEHSSEIVEDPQYNINQIRPLPPVEFARMKKRVEQYRAKGLQAAPIRLLQLQVKNYRGIDHLNVGFREDAPWIFLTGENGYGKTVILQALALALGQYRNETYSIQLEEKPDLIEAKIRSRTRESVTCKPTREQGRPASYNFVAYGSSRQQMHNNGDNNKTNSPYYGLFEPDAIFRDLEAKLQAWALQKEDTQHPFFDKLMQFIEEVLGYLLPTEFDLETNQGEETNKQEGIPIRIERNEEGAKIYYTIAYQNDKPVEKTYKQLSAGYRNIIGFVGDMLVRFYENSKNDEDPDPAELTGIVLIDEIELHLHPKWQRELVKRLHEVFPKVQFVVSTHSPIPLLGAPANSQIFHVTRTNAAGIQMEDISDRMNIKHYNLTPDTLLSSPIFGFTDLVPAANEELTDLRTENSYREAEETEDLKKRVEAGAEIRAAAYQKWMNP